jgi:uncharacterized protein (DUF1501 family)
MRIQRVSIDPRESGALTTSELSPVTSVSGAPYRVPFEAGRSRQPVLEQRTGGGGEYGPLVQPLTRAQYQNQQAAIPLNLFSHADQQLAWQTSIAQGHSPTGWAGRAADYIASQNLNSSSFPSFFSVAGNAVEGAGVSTNRSRWPRGSRCSWRDSAARRHRRRVSAQ